MTTTSITTALWRTWRDRPRNARVTDIHCPACRRWRNPRHFNPDAACCRDCNQ